MFCKLSQKYELIPILNIMSQILCLQVCIVVLMLMQIRNVNPSLLVQKTLMILAQRIVLITRFASLFYQNNILKYIYENKRIFLSFSAHAGETNGNICTKLIFNLTKH